MQNGDRNVIAGTWPERRSAKGDIELLRTSRKGAARHVARKICCSLHCVQFYVVHCVGGSSHRGDCSYD